MVFSSDPIKNLASLIQCPSVTPEEAGVFSVLSKMLEPMGFRTQRVTFSEDGFYDVENFYASLSQGKGRHFMFAGHTDVVPPGDEMSWRYQPFSATIKEGVIYGRGAVDMKGAIACFIAAVARYLEEGREIKGELSFLITGDEEKLAVNGTIKLLEWAKGKGYSWDAALVGEPTSSDVIGDIVKIGRRGSLSGSIIVHGVQCHVAYDTASQNNPIRKMLLILDALLGRPFDSGTENFSATNMEIISIDVGNTTMNMIPSKASARFNVRFNNLWTSKSLEKEIQDRIDSLAISQGINYTLEWYKKPSESFLTNNKDLAEKLAASIEKVTGKKPSFSTSGGTSDARFIKEYCPVVECGLLHNTAHMVDEHVSLDDLEQLTQIYKHFLIDWFV